MSANCFEPQCRLPETIKDVCTALVGKNVIIVLKGCCKEAVEILAVRDSLCICKTCNGNIKFIKIECICGVITNCADVVMGLLR